MGRANGTSWQPLMILPTTYAPLLRKNRPESTWNWKLARSFTWSKCGFMASSTRWASRSRSSKGTRRLKSAIMRSTSDSMLAAVG
ncbi:hypothetical protein D9M68_689130 [compost metagenome]